MLIQERLKTYQSRVDSYLKQQLKKSSLTAELSEAMDYALFNGGKRIRPALVYLVNDFLGGNAQQADAAAAAIETIHSYSLVHDDLPAMDDDALRRGQPSCHIAYSEATAILAGDALQCFCFELLSQTKSNPEQQLKMIHIISQASGYQGMAAGQAYDLQQVDQQLSLEQLNQMHQHKTGALIVAAIQLGALSSGCPTIPEQALINYAKAIGLAFQVRDDILDELGDSQTLGKPAGSDAEANKPTYTRLLGVAGAQEKLLELEQQAYHALANLGPAAEPLRQLAEFIVKRKQ